jgi:hypothetical protein
MGTVEGRPRGVGAVVPAEGTSVEPGSSIGASVRVPPSEYEYSVRLILDGDDVSEGMRVAVFMTYPRTMIQISYLPDPPPPPGEHSVLIEYSDERGAEWSYAWRFFVS